MLLVFQVLAVLAVVFGVAALLTGRAEGLSSEFQDLASTGIPRDRAMTPEDVQGLRFALALRGYRMDEVDDALDRLAAEIAARDEAIAQLRVQVERSTSSSALVEEPPAPDLPAMGEAWAAPPLPPLVEEPVAAEPAPVTTEPAPVTTEPAPVTAEPEAPVLAAPDAPPPNPFRPEVPDIPAYDPWSVTPRSRYADGPQHLEVEHHDEDDDPVAAITEHQTGYALPPPDAPDAPEAPAAEDDDEPEAYKPPWQS